MCNDDIETTEDMLEIVERYLFKSAEEIRRLPWIHGFESLSYHGCKFWTLGGQYGPMFSVEIK